MRALREREEPPVRPDSAYPVEADDEIDLGRLLGILWRGRWKIAGLAVIGLAFGLFYLANTAPTYQADALLQLEERGGNMALPEAMRDLVDSEPRSMTEIEILRSRMILGRVVAELNLDWEVRPKLAPVLGTMLSRYSLPLPDLDFLDIYARPGDEINLALLEVPPDWLDRELTIMSTDAGFLLVDPDGREWNGTPDETLRDPDLGFALRIDAVNAPPGRMFTIRQINDIAAIGKLRSDISMSERGRETGVLEARLQGPDRREAVRVLDAIIQTYVRQNISRSAAEAESSLEFIESQLPEAEADLRRAEGALNAFRQEETSIDLSFETENLLTQVTRIEGELQDLETREDELSQRYTQSHPSYQQLLSERARLQERLEQLRGEMDSLPETQREILNLNRDLEVAQGIYTQLLTQAQEMQVLRASTVGNVRVIDSAAAGGDAVAPRRNLVLALSVVLGLVAGAGLILLREWLRKGVQSAEELEQAGLPVFATINYTPHADHKHKRKGHLPILAVEEPTELAVEAFRSLRTSLHFGMIDARTRSLAITSSAPEAGKSFTAINLAVVAAQAGQRVCLVDADLRRGQLRRHFDLPRNQPGLAEVLAGTIPLEEALQQGVLSNLAFLPSGRYPPNPSELLMRHDFAVLVETLDSQFDLTVFDCPPTLAVTDPVIVARSVGATVLVARHDTTPMTEVDAVRKTMSASGARLSGAILNGFDPRKARSGYGYGYGYSYRYEYTSRKD
ncbi:MAG: tyrosine-protein kinase Etk/Wzc [Rhodobacteraceae bacterium HLUCCA12]|nr:MAG: tyrosine-protein kinase Etk/Wzc [Rhodobacteraceae bacterium HLUCCA12]